MSGTGSDLKTLMERKNWRILDVASAAGVSIGTISRFLQNKPIQAGSARLIQDLLDRYKERPETKQAVG